MKILISAYACNPFGGSEPGVGWAAVCRIAKRHEVCVLTDIHNRAGWERGATEGLIPSNVKVRFLREPWTYIENRFIAHLQSWMNYRSFNNQVLAAAAAWHEEERFDLCHQVTIAAWRMPSPLWRLPIPFVWGPIGGAGYIPPAFRGILSPSARGFERMRDLNTALASRSRAFRECIGHSAVVIAANEETESFLNPYRKNKPLLRLPVTPFSNEKVNRLRRMESKSSPNRPLRLFAGGNMEGRKGLAIALRSLSKAVHKGVSFHYTIGGGGPEITSLKALAIELGLDNHVTFHPGFSGADYIKTLHDTDVYFLPSFRETMGMTLVEAIFAGCYPVVADTSAQGEIVRLAKGKAVPIDTMDRLIDGLAEAIIWCDEHREHLPFLAAESALILADYCSPQRYDKTLENAYELALNVKH